MKKKKKTTVFQCYIYNYQVHPFQGNHLKERIGANK